MKEASISTQDQARLTRLITAAIRAPSGDNCQPWSFQFEGPRRILIRTVPERAKSFFDYKSCATLLSLGAVIENMRVQAASEGWSIQVSYEKEAGSRGPAATVQLVPDIRDRVTSNQVEAMFQRTVNRRPFLPRPLPSSTLAQLTVDAVEQTHVQVITERREIAQWARVIELGDRIRFSHPLIHEELFSKLLFTKETAERVRVGLEVDRLGMGPLAGPLLQWLRPWDRMTRLSRWGLTGMLAGQSRLLALATGALGLVTVSDTGRDAWIHAGEQVQRLWVRAQQYGLAVHPMTVALYLDQRYQDEGTKDFLPCHDNLLKELRGRLNKLLPGTVGTMLFRLGKALPIRDVAMRLPIEQFIVERN